MEGFVKQTDEPREIPTQSDKKTHFVWHEQQVNIIQIVLAKPTNGGGQRSIPQRQKA
jgi:hypothetical protein